MAKIAVGARIANALVMACVAGASFLLLLYVGYGEASRTYEQFHVEKLTAQAKVLVNAVDTFLKRDLPLHQYVGFKPRAERLLSSDKTIVSMAVFNDRHELIFAAGDSRIGELPAGHAYGATFGGQDVEVRRTSGNLQVVLPLTGSHGTVGSFAITMPSSLIADQVSLALRHLAPLATGLAIAFALFVGVCSQWLSRQRWPILQLTYAGLFLVFASLIVYSLLPLYTKGAQIKTMALADSLGQRMLDVVGLNLDTARIPGLHDAFTEYRRLNPDIAAAAMVVDGTILIHTDPTKIGQPWQGSQGNYEYLIDISSPGSSKEVNIAVVLPEHIVYWRTLRSVKNFAAVFIASAFLASLFMQLAGSAYRRQERAAASNANLADERRILGYVKPVFYVTMCVEHLSYAFLAKHIDTVVQAAGFPAELTSTIFAIYYLCFALALVPAGHIAQRLSPKLLMLAGLALTAIALLLMNLGGIGALILARAAAGLGQATLFIGVQSYILAVVAPTKKTQGAAIIVYGFQGGMISGMAIGSLLVSDIGSYGVFAVGAVVTLLTAAYTFLILPAIKPIATSSIKGLGTGVVGLARQSFSLLRDRDLLLTIGFIGVPAKAVLTGAILFALPLLLAQQGYRQEDIGQLLMLYAGGVLVANGVISQWVDGNGDARLVLVAGTVISGIGLCLISQLGALSSDDGTIGSAVEVLLVLLGVMLLGCAHGLINAPIISHVAGMDLGHRIGVSSLTASYRFIERLGHIAGPILIGQLFLLGGERAVILAWIGVVLMLFGGLFFWLSQTSASRAYHPRSHDQAVTLAIDDLVSLLLDPPHQVLVLGATTPETALASDPIQAAMLQHLERHGKLIDASAIASQADGFMSGHQDVSALVADRRRALRFKRFLEQIDHATPLERQLLVIAGCPELHLATADVRRWLQRRPNSRLILVTSAEAWLAQLRGWLTLSSLDVGLGYERPGAEQLLTKLKLHFAEDGPCQPLIWMNVATCDGVGPGGHADTAWTETNPTGRPVNQPISWRAGR